MTRLVTTIRVALSSLLLSKAWPADVLPVSRSSRFASARTAVLGMEASASSQQARRSASRLTFTHSSHRARRARVHASIRRSSSCAFLRYEKRAERVSQNYRS